MKTQQEIEKTLKKMRDSKKEYLLVSKSPEKSPCYYSDYLTKIEMLEWVLSDE